MFSGILLSGGIMLKSRSIKPEKKEVGVFPVPDGGIIKTIDISKEQEESSKHRVSSIGLTSKNHVKQPLFVKPVLCHTCGFDYLKKRIPILQKRDKEGDKTGIYVCKKCVEVQRG